MFRVMDLTVYGRGSTNSLAPYFCAAKPAPYFHIAVLKVGHPDNQERFPEIIRWIVHSERRGGVQRPSLSN